MLRIVCTAALVAASLHLVAPPCAAQTPERYVAVADSERVPRQPYRRWFTTDAFDRRIVLYLSEEPANGPPLPLVVYVHGSGCASLFANGERGVQPTSGHATLRDLVAGRARLLLVEKPGVTFLDAPANPGSAANATAEFREQHTLERWCAAVHGSLLAARKLPGIRADRTLVAGHSEGGIVAARLAADDPSITHVATLAGGGPTQLFDLVELARAGTFFADVSPDPAARAAHALAAWRRIAADPDSATELFLGHPHRRWSSFLATSTLDQLARGKARVYVAHASRDAAVAAASFELVHAELTARGRDATFDLVDGADHSFAFTDRSRDGWREVLARITDWFLADVPAAVPGEPVRR